MDDWEGKSLGNDRGVGIKKENEWGGLDGGGMLLCKDVKVLHDYRWGAGFLIASGKLKVY